MTDTTKQTLKKGDRPTHSLMVKSEQFEDPLNMRLAAIWNNPDKGYMSLSASTLQLRENIDAKGNDPRFSLFLKTKIYGQEARVEIGSITPEEKANCFEVNLGDLVIFETKPDEAKAKKQVSASQPKPA